MVHRYLGSLYLKYIFLILFSLVLFFVGLDFVQALKSLPSSASLQILYAVYRFFHGVDILFPISLVFAMISLKLYLIRSNELVAFYAAGYSKKALIRPLFLIAIVLTFFYLVLHMTSFSYADEYAKNIRKFHTFVSSTKNLFFKYKESYVYFDELIPLQKSAKRVRIFELNGSGGSELSSLILAKKAAFHQESWHLPNATVVKKLPHKIAILSKDIDTLQGYRPTILDSVYEGKTAISLLDAIYAFRLFKKQHIRTKKIEAVILYQLFFPFFAPFLMVIIFYFVPVTTRLGNLGLFSFGAMLAVLITWGLLYALAKLAFTESIDPFVAIVLPQILLFGTALWFYKKF